MDLKLSDPWKILVAPGFPLGAFDQMEPVFDLVRDGIRKTHLIRAWVNVAYRHRSCVEDSAAFASAIADMKQDGYPYERPLYSFFTSGLSALESVGFGVHAIGSSVAPDGFPMATAEDCRNVTLGSTQKRLGQSFAGYEITTLLRELQDDDAFSGWCNWRNQMTHRATPGLGIRVTVGTDAVTYLGDSDEVLAPELTEARLEWLERWLSRLLPAAVDFGTAALRKE